MQNHQYLCPVRSNCLSRFPSKIWTLILHIILVALVISIATILSSPDAQAFSGGKTIKIRAEPILEFVTGQSQQNFGALKFLGGLALSSNTPEFGALSGLAIQPDGTKILAVSDTGYWLGATLIRRHNRMTDITDVFLAPILDENGRPLNHKQKWNADAEGLLLSTFRDEQRAIISFERQRGKLRIINLSRQGFQTPTQILPESALLDKLRGNRGIEAIAIAPENSPLAGRLIGIGERVLSNGHHTGWILDGKTAKPFRIKRRDEFDITAADFLPNGDLLLLERRFSLSLGSAMRIRRLAAQDLSPNKLNGDTAIDGIDLITADLSHQIDNMEGMAVHTNTDGHVIITLVSDDNMNFFQRSLILEFMIRPEEFGVKPRPRPNFAFQN